MEQFQEAFLAYAERLYKLSRATKDADDRPKYEQRLAALVPIFIEIYSDGSIKKLQELVQVEIRREGLDFFPKDLVAAKKLAEIQGPFFELFK